MGVVADVERELGRLRCRDEAEGLPDLRTSTLTHVVWAPPRWLELARRTFAGLAERHPARTIFLVPERGAGGVETEVSLRSSVVDGGTREVVYEVIVLRLRGTAAEHPASVVRPLLVSDLPAFCRWRGEPPGPPRTRLVTYPVGDHNGRVLWIEIVDRDPTAWIAADHFLLARRSDSATLRRCTSARRCRPRSTTASWSGPPTTRASTIASSGTRPPWRSTI